MAMSKCPRCGLPAWPPLAPGEHERCAAISLRVCVLAIPRSASRFRMHTVAPGRHVRLSPREHSHLTRPACCSTDQSRYAELCCDDFACDALYEMGGPPSGSTLGMLRPSVTYQDMAGTGPACVCSVVACAQMPHGDRDSPGWCAHWTPIGDGPCYPRGVCTAVREGACGPAPSCLVPTSCFGRHVLDLGPSSCATRPLGPTAGSVGGQGVRRNATGPCSRGVGR